MADVADIRTVLKQWPLPKLIALVVVFLLTVAGIGGLVWWGQTLDYQVLYSNLSVDDASAVTQRLKELKVPYKLDAGGTAVLVPAEQVYDLRMELAAGGLLKGGGVGFEIFDETKFGMTEFLQKVNYRRALQGELARTIGQLAEVSAARVHISIPEKSIFTEEKEQSKASVVVTLKSGQSLNRKQVQGIVRLVSSSVEGLRPDYVTVLNSSGELLSTPRDDDSEAAISSTQAEYLRGITKGYEQRVQSMLDGVLGNGKSIVRVDLNVDFRRVERTEQKVDPDAVAVVNESRGSEKSSGSSPGGGIPGVVSNTPGTAPAQAAGGGSSSSEKQNESISYEVTKTVSRIVEPTGVIKKINVAVMVDGTYKTDDAGKESYVARTPEEIKHLEDLVRTAVGIDDTRGDRIVLTNIPFQREKVEEAPAPGFDWKKYLPTVLKWALPMLAAAAAFFLILRPLLNVVRSTPIPAETFPRPLAQFEGAGEAALTGAGAGVGQLGGGAPARQAAIPELVKGNPGQAASIVKEWMNEE